VPKEVSTDLHQNAQRIMLFVIKINRFNALFKKRKKQTPINIKTKQNQRLKTTKNDKTSKSETWKHAVLA